MSYSTSSIGAVLNQINVVHFLPAIQRPFVWKQEQTVELFDSLLKKYPIGTFMFWQLEDATKPSVRIYRFIEAYSGEVSMNEPAQTEGRNIVLVLDGQQRLTSLLVGLRGSFAAKKKHTHRSNPDNWEPQNLYIDLLKDPNEVGDDGDGEAETGVTYGLKFHGAPPRSSHRHLWLKLATILNYPSAEQLGQLEEKMLQQLRSDATAYERDLVLDTLRRLHEVVWGAELINYYVEKDQSLDRVLDIFVRSNSSGSALKKADFLMSMITSRWENGAAREEVASFARRLGKELPLPNTVGVEFLMKACLTLCDFEVKFNVANFTGEAIREIERNWSSIKAALENTFRLINNFGVGDDNRSSLNVVLPIAFYLYRTPDFTFRGTTAFEAGNRQLIQRWLLQSMLVGAFGGQSDRTISRARQAIRDGLKSDRNFPIEGLFQALAGGGRVSQLDERGIEEVLDLEYNKGKTLLALSLLSSGLDWAGTAYHVDHIIPQADAGRRVLQGQNLQQGRIDQIAGAVNRLGNLQLLAAGENVEKSALSFASWINSRDRDYLRRNFIPDMPELWVASRLPEFVAEREKLIRAKLMGISGLRTAPQHG